MIQLIQVCLNMCDLLVTTRHERVNKPTRVTGKTATGINHILTNCSTKTVFKTAAFKSDIFDHIPICFLVRSSSTQRETKTTFIYKIIFNTESINVWILEY